jgi:hypothetical protein
MGSGLLYKSGFSVQETFKTFLFLWGIAVFNLICLCLNIGLSKKHFFFKNIIHEFFLGINHFL